MHAAMDVRPGAKRSYLPLFSSSNKPTRDKTFQESQLTNPIMSIDTASLFTDSRWSD